MQEWGLIQNNFFFSSGFVSTHIGFVGNGSQFKDWNPSFYRGQQSIDFIGKHKSPRLSMFPFQKAGFCFKCVI